MRVFITGATGYIGGAVAPALREHGHELTALVRPETDSTKLRDLGVAIVAGDLTSLPSLAGSLGDYDAFIHLAQANTSDAAALSRTALDVFTAQRGFLVYTSGVWVCGNTDNEVVDESTPPNPLPIVAWRPEQEQAALATGRSAVLRPGCVYGGRQSLCRGWFEAAEKKQPVYLVGDGNNQWAMVNLHDLADCYVRIIEQSATGILHAVDDTNETLLGCALAAAPGSVIETIPIEVARQKSGAFADALAIDQRVSSAATRRKLGWSPSREFTSSLDEQWLEFRSGG
ncbi:MAG TPA: NAD-dependent epimerase/dehydratase family protein [Thermoanaerobaculia bacterium]|jgi:nucleoside-diphosphate-sugar epimerase|nr:NAD-dependent epimerase/dehydratase family protein [Thermoanaerobaculia bacterium]